ncbi:type II secretion system F family protein [Lederbergia sp. NSJ-179]|uniref:type II secretion system F family protein n=1 Tax=Lederbergia sp. NSJ-179 TaxID=2931402 RepID=UPI001FD3E4D6|nr:type II secretion system F family protein [Lederbergia sp. NSJ-179]MCJ7840226.1 type II secretion system F family protein [Lederbergia sp. NSJ-179]
MNQDMWILLLLPVLLVIYIVMNRKSKQKQGQQTSKQAANQSVSVKKVVEEKKEAALKRTRKVEGHLIDYSKYQLSIKEFLFYSIMAMIALFLIGFLFYESVIFSLILAVAGLLFPRMQRKRLLLKRKEKLAVQFKEAIASLSSSLAAGRSIENSFRETVHDLKFLYPDPNTYIIREFEIINRRVENGETIERAIQDFALRSDLEDVINFSDIFITCKRTGGNLVEVIRRTADVISEKIDIQQEVQVMLAQKKFESKILSIMPVGMIALLKYSSGDYLAPLYDWAKLGPLIMTFCLALLCLSYWLSQRIMNIKV